VILLAGLLAAWPACAQAAGSLKISNRFSAMNRFRDTRPRTDFIILHTTEGGDRSSLDRIRRRGLAHYVVKTNGQVHRVVSRKKVALHAGRSMWDGVQNLDRRSVAIEVVGYNNKPITHRQIQALRELLRQLQKIYDIPDDHVLTHSMVAFGKPNRWHRKNHRGRKRCGMQFATPGLRRQLGLESRPLVDPDVKAGRLIEADPYLAQVLYEPDDSHPVQPAGNEEDNIITARHSAWDIAREEYDDPSTIYVFPSGTRRRGDEIRDWSMIPPGTKVLLEQGIAGNAPLAVPPVHLTLGRNQAASKVVGRAYDDYSTVYVLPSGRIKRGDTLGESEFRSLPPGTRIFLGVEFAGTVTRHSTAYQLCGARFKAASTVYLLPSGRVERGNTIREDRIPSGTLVLVKS
jgi:N-acetylmuramoyl-L-alanine amidase